LLRAAATVTREAALDPELRARLLRARRRLVGRDAVAQVEEHELDDLLLRRERLIVALARERRAVHGGVRHVEVAEEYAPALLRGRCAPGRVERVVLRRADVIGESVGEVGAAGQLRVDADPAL